jgi:hypothetical protein
MFRESFASILTYPPDVRLHPALRTKVGHRAKREKCRHNRTSPALSDDVADVGENRRRSLSSGPHPRDPVGFAENHEATTGPSSLDTHRLCDAPR